MCALFRQYTLYRRYRLSLKKKAATALTAGCRYLVSKESPLYSYVTLGLGLTCKMGGHGLCAVRSMTCVDHGAAMCCPIGCKLPCCCCFIQCCLDCLKRSSISSSDGAHMYIYNHLVVCNIYIYNMYASIS